MVGGEGNNVVTRDRQGNVGMAVIPLSESHPGTGEGDLIGPAHPSSVIL